MISFYSPVLKIIIQQRCLIFLVPVHSYYILLLLRTQFMHNLLKPDMNICLSRTDQISNSFIPQPFLDFIPSKFHTVCILFHFHLEELSGWNWYLGQGSHEQSVTCNIHPDDVNSFWNVQPAFGRYVKRGFSFYIIFPYFIFYALQNSCDVWWYYSVGTY